MAFCTKCGTQFEAGTVFCGSCDAAVAAVGTSGTKAPNIPQQEPVSGAPEKKTTSLLERFTSSWKIRVVVIVLTLVGVGIYYSYTQRHRQALIETVRNSHMPEFPNVTVGQALESNFKNYKWTTFKNPDKSITVGFVGYQTFQDALGNLDHPDFASCLKRTFCQPIVKKISDSCIPTGATGEPSQQQQSCFNNGVVNNANTLIPVHLLFAANDQNGSVSLIKTDLVPDQILHGDEGSSTTQRMQADPTTTTTSTGETMQAEPTTTITSTGETVTTKMGNSPLDAEARAEALKVLEGMLTQCGDKYYIWNDIGWNHDEFIEFRDKPHFSIGSGPMSDMDRLNGLTWQGSAGMSGSSAERVLKLHEIEPWREGQGHGFQLRKFNNVWEFSQTWRKETEKDGTTLVDGFSDKVPCEQVSVYLSQNGASGAGSQ